MLRVGNARADGAHFATVAPGTEGPVFLLTDTGWAELVKAPGRRGNCPRTCSPPDLALAASVDFPYNGPSNGPFQSPSRSAVVLRIVPYPHPALRYESRPVTRIDDELRATAREMFDLMYAARGIGLAANQVGLPYRFFVLNLTADPEQKDQERVFINPEIVKRHSSIEDEEGCLSFPGLYAKVQRARKIKVQAFDLDGNLVEIDRRRPPRPGHPARDRPPRRPAVHRPARPARAGSR